MDPADNAFMSATRSQGNHRWSGLLARRSGDVLPLSDFLCVLSAGALSALLLTIWAPDADAVLVTDRFTAVFVTALVAAFTLYDEHFAHYAGCGNHAALLRRFALRFLQALAITAAVGLARAEPAPLPMSWLLLWSALCLPLLFQSRIWLASRVLSLTRSGATRQVVAVVGAPAECQAVIARLRGRPMASVEILGAFSDTDPTENVAAADANPGFAQLQALAGSRKIDWLLLALPEIDEEHLRRLVERLQRLQIPIGLCPHDAGIVQDDYLIDYMIDGVPVTLLADRPIKRWNAVAKSVEDMVLGWMITLALLPLFVLIAVLIKLDSPGPVIFKQRRHGYNNCEFDIYKFRTMVAATTAPSANLQQTTRRDPRITRVGRLLRASSLDEIPQLFNVLEGSMSLVGPRPHAVNMRTEAQLCHEIIDVYPHRHRVKPGITGWSQVNGLRGATDTAEQVRRRVEFDLYYVTHWSLWLDLKIGLMTVREVLRRTNAF